MKEKLDNLIKLVALWTVGVLGGVLFSLLKIFGRIKVIGFDTKKIYPNKKGLIVAYNHPSLWEPGLIPFLFFPFFLFSLRFTPYSTPDKRNFFDKWWFYCIRCFCIPIDRQGGRTKGLRNLIRSVNEGRIVILAPEGGRTEKGEDFKILRDGKIIIRKKSELSLEENNFPKIRRFQNGFSGLLKLTEAPVLLVWTEGGDKVIPNKFHFPKGPYFLYPDLKEKTIIRIGKRIRTKNIFQVEDELLKLSQDGTSAP